MREIFKHNNVFWIVGNRQGSFVDLTSDVGFVLRVNYCLFGLSREIAVECAWLRAGGVLGKV